MASPIRAYLFTTGAVFGIITIAHIWRLMAESRALAHDPWFILMTLVTAGLCVWAVRLYRLTARPR